jgi:hypothetical protein
VSESPDDSDLLAEVLLRKAEGRRALAKKSFGEKIAAMEALRERVAPIKAARERSREAARRAHSPSPQPGEAASMRATNADRDNG